MPFERQTRAELLHQAAIDFNTDIPGVDATVRHSMVGVLSRLHGMAMDSQYAYSDWIARQIHPATADEEMLLRAASLWLSTPRRDATFAAGTVQLTGDDGAVAVVGTVLRRADGALFATQAEATIASGVAVVQVQAQAAGAAGNCLAATPLTLLSPVSGIDSAATVTGAGIIGGADLETLAGALARLKRRVQTPPRAGTADDFVGWMFDAHPGVTRAWCFPRESGLGSITCRFACDDTYAGGIPLTADVDQVAAYLEGSHSVSGLIITRAPAALPVNITITGLTPSTTLIRADVAARLASVFRTDGTPGGRYKLSGAWYDGGKILRSHLEEAIGSAAGVRDFALTEPAGNVQAATGYLPTLGTIAWA